jgi:DNA-binding MarR family transcriptional regulator
MRCYCATARRLARRLTRMYEAELRPAGMNPAQFELMNHLRARPGLSQAVLAAALDVDQTTLSRNLRLLIQQRWVRASSGAKDRRVWAYDLTEAGSRALQTAMPLWRRAHERVQAALPDDARVWQSLAELAAAPAEPSALS